MQNNALVRIFGILFAIVSIYQLSFTFITSQQEQNAAEFAARTVLYNTEDYLEKRERTAIKYLDSIGNNSLYAYTSYNDAKGKELNKGLDLKGGINVILQISIKDILKGLAENSKNPVFNQALDDADRLQKASDVTYIESFFTAFDAIKGTTTLATPDIFANRTLSDEITFDMSDAQAQVVLNRKIDESIISAFEVLRKRIDKFGVTQPNIQRLGNSGRILVELPGAKDVERIQNLLQSTAQLEFWETFKSDEIASYLVQANEVAKKYKITEEKQKSESSEIDDLLADIATEDSTTVATQNPLLDLIKGYGFQGGPVIAQFAIKDQVEVMSYLNDPEARKVLPSQFRYARFVWGKPAPNSELSDLYALQSNRNNLAPLSGGVVVDAVQSYNLK